MSVCRGPKGWLVFCLALPLATASVIAQSAPAPAPDPGPPLVMPGFAMLTGFHLMAPGGKHPLTQRHIEVITVTGEVDPPFTNGDDRLDLVNPEYNEPRFKDLMNGDPGLVTASMTIWIEETKPEDNKVQAFERIIVRVYDAEDKDKAKHYCDTTPWKAQPGFIDLTPELVQFGEWKAIDKRKANSK
jgi:hypothetical protein